MKGISLAFFLSYLFSLFFVCSNVAISGQSNKNILVLHSHIEDLSSQNPVEAGFLENIADSNAGYSIDIYRENLDTARKNDPLHFQNLYQLYRYKFKTTEFDLILAVGDDAFQFIQTYHDALFADTPTVFCGVQEFEPTQRKPWQTGVLEKLDIYQTLETALKLHPDTKKVIALDDIDSRSSKNRVLYWDSVAPFTNMVEFLYFNNLTLSEIENLIGSLSSNTLILLFSFNHDRKDNLYHHREVIKTIASVSPVPIYALNDTYLGHGIVGGKLSVEYQKGKRAALLAKEILSGTPPMELQIADSNMNEFLFDYRVLTQFDIHPVNLPPESRIINLPPPFFVFSAFFVWSVLGVVMVLVLLIVIMIRVIIKRRLIEANLRDSEERYRSIINTTTEGFMMISMNYSIVDVNQSFCDMLGYTREEILHKKPSDFATEESQPLLVEQMNKMPYTLQRNYDCGFLTRNGREIIANIRATTVRDRFGNPMYAFAFVTEMTDMKSAEKALKESEAKFRLLSETITGGILIIHNDLLVYVNKAFEKISGYSMEELVGQNYREYIYPKDRHLLQLGVIESDRPEEINQHFEIRIINKNESVVWLDVTLSGSIYYEQKLSYMINVFDITERKKAEEALRESENLYRILTEASQDILFVVDYHGEVTYVNPAAERAIGYPKDMIVGKTVNAIFPKNIANRQLENIQNTLREGEAIYVEDQSVMQNRNVWLGTWLIPIRSEDGKFRSVLGIARDISERIRKMDSLIEERTRLAIILRSISDSIVALDKNMKIILTNKACEELLGISWDEALGKPVHKILRLESKNQDVPFYALLDQVLDNGSQVDLYQNYQLHLHSGIIKPVSGQLSPIRDKDDSISGAVIVLRDMTEKEQIEKKMESINRVESLGVFAGGIAHDFNNILTSILGNVSLARVYLDMPNYADKIPTILTDAENACSQAKFLTQQLLTFAKGNTPVKKTENPNAVIESVSSFVLRGSKLKVQYRLQENLPYIDMDAGQISQVIQNIIVNALEANPDGGKLLISSAIISVEELHSQPRWKGTIFNHNDYIQILIQDNGKGIAPDVIERIFEPYFTTKQNGSGLGLALAYSLVKNHNGYITVESQKNQGAAFYILLPFSQSASGVLSPKVSNKKPVQGSGRVLIMDDEPNILKLMEEYLNLLGYEVTRSQDGEELIRLYTQAKKQKRPYHLVIMDFTMNGKMNGVETMEKLKRVDPKVKAIVQSGYSKDIVLTNYSDYGFQGVIYKPFKIGEFSEEVDRVMRQKK